MDTKQLDELLALHGKATPLPWTDAGNKIGADGSGIAEVEFDRPEDLSLVVAMRNALPSLIAQAREAIALRAEVAEFKAFEGFTSRAWDGSVPGLNVRQWAVMPFTCGSGNRSDAAHTAYREKFGGDFGQLIAAPDCWKCPVCDYTQPYRDELAPTPEVQR